MRLTEFFKEGKVQKRPKKLDSVSNGLHWWQVDCSGYIIWTLERVSLIRDVYRVSPPLMARRAARKASGVLATPVLLDEGVQKATVD